jgi:hypothetical protein
MIDEHERVTPNLLCGFRSNLGPLTKVVDVRASSNNDKPDGAVRPLRLAVKIDRRSLAGFSLEASGGREFGAKTARREYQAYEDDRAMHACANAPLCAGRQEEQ